MSEFGQNIKNIVIKGIDLIGNKANDLASSAKQKVDVFNLENQKKDLLAELGSKVYAMCLEGKELPEELLESLQAVKEIDGELSVLNTARKEAEAAGLNDASSEAGLYTEIDLPDEEKAAEAGTEAAEYAAADDTDVPVLKVETEEDDKEEEESCPLSSAINDLFENIPPVDKMMNKVNSSLDELGENLLKFSDQLGKQINEFTDKMMDNDENQKQ